MMVFDRPSKPRRTLTVAVRVFALVLLVMHLTMPQSYGRTDNKTKPVIFIHGAEGHCEQDFGELIDNMRANVWTGGFHFIEFRNGDEVCSDTPAREPFWNSGIWNYGTHADIYGHSGTNHDTNTDIRHLAWHLAWWLHDWYAGEPPMDVVAHSMGGLIIRVALAKEGQSCGCSLGSWPELQIEDVITLGTPHAGIPALANPFLGVQGDQMNEGSFLMDWLATNAQNPQGDGGTEWTVVGSLLDGNHDDTIVSGTSATAMNVPNRFKYATSLAPWHSGYMHMDWTSPAHVWYGYWYYDSSVYGAMTLTRVALRYANW